MSGRPSAGGSLTTLSFRLRHLSVSTNHCLLSDISRVAAVISLIILPLLMTPTPEMLVLIGLALQAQPFKAANLLDPLFLRSFGSAVRCHIRNVKA